MCLFLCCLLFRIFFSLFYISITLEAHIGLFYSDITMKVSIKLLRCVKCHNVYDNKVSLINEISYKDLHEITCSKCSNKWLICVIHGLRWSQRRYVHAEDHVKSLHQNIVDNSPNNYCNNELLSLSNDDTSDFSRFDSNDEICISVDSDDNVSFSGNTIDIGILDKFLNCHRAICLNNYNSKVKRYIECESRKAGDGIKQIVKCAFAMNLNGDFGNISINEIKYHLKATMFCCSLTASQQANFGELCYMMLNTGLNDPNLS